MSRLAGTIAVLIWAGLGTGRAASLLFAHEGEAVACVDNDAEMGVRTATVIQAKGGDALFIECDLIILAAI
jgi:NAD(P)-dependent dehydrogenase (short-subunit alcohol dehydrogenase family)